MWEGSDDEGAGVVLEINAVEECREVEQETRCPMLFIGRLVAYKEYVGGGNKWACMQAYVLRSV